MAATAGKAAEVWAESGSSVAFTTEACSLVSGTTYEITDTSKRHWDPDTAVSVYDDGTLQTSGYTLQAPIGRVVFDSAPTTPVTVSGNYFSAAKIAECTGWEISYEADMLEDTALGDSARTYVPGLIQFSGTFSKWWANDTYRALVGAAGGVQYVAKLYTDQANGKAYIGYINLSSDSISVSVDSLIEESVEFSGYEKLYYLDSGA